MKTKHTIDVRISGEMRDKESNIFINMLYTIHGVIFEKLASKDLSPVKIKILVTEQFVESVEDSQKRAGLWDRKFDTGRIGGEVAGKCINMNPEFDEFEIIVNQNMWLASSGEDISAH